MFCCFLLFVFVVFNCFCCYFAMPYCSSCGFSLIFLPFLLIVLSYCFLQHLSSEENCPSTHSSQSDSQYGSPPRGWSEELDEHGPHTLCIWIHQREGAGKSCLHTEISFCFSLLTQSNTYFFIWQWIKHVDEQGRPYYYSADGSRSEWELPKVRF